MFVKDTFYQKLCCGCGPSPSVVASQLLISGLCIVQTVHRRNLLSILRQVPLYRNLSVHLLRQEAAQSFTANIAVKFNPYICLDVVLH